MKSEQPWWGDHEKAEKYLTALFSRAGIKIITEAMEDERPRAVMKLNAPIGEPLYVTAHIQGATLRFIAHKVVLGQPTLQARENYRQVNLAPWAGRVYASADQTGTDLSLGIPVPRDQLPTLDVELFVRLIFESAMQLRTLNVPGYFGPAIADTEQFYKMIREFCSQAGLSCAAVQDGHVIVADTYTPAGNSIRLEMFVLDARLLVCRLHLAADFDTKHQQSMLEKLAWINQVAASGAIEWDPESKRLLSQTVIYPALMPITDYELSWLVSEAGGLIDAVINNDSHWHAVGCN